VRLTRSRTKAARRRQGLRLVAVSFRSAYWLPPRKWAACRLISGRRDIAHLPWSADVRATVPELKVSLKSLLRDRTSTHSKRDQGKRKDHHVAEFFISHSPGARTGTSLDRNVERD